MASDPVPAPLVGFTRLGHSSYIYEPPATSTTTSKAPDVILLTTFMNATPRHVAKYTSGYKILYPHARIIVIQTSLAVIVWKSASYKREHRRPVLEVLLALPPDTKLLWHTFSNGGSYTASMIAQDYAAITGRALPAMAEIFDSCPGRIHRGRTVEAFLAAAPKNVVIRQILYAFLVAYLLLVELGDKVSGQKNHMVRMWDEMNEERYFEPGTPRLYLWSKEDNMIYWKDVLDHMQDAEAKGWKCEGEEFVGSMHCNHLGLDPVKYWSAVERVWERAELEKGK